MGRVSRNCLIGAVLATGVVVLVLIVWYLAEVLLLTFAAVLTAIFFSAIGDLFAPLGFSRGWRIGIAIVLLLSFAIIMSVVAYPSFMEQFSALFDKLPEALLHLQSEAQKALGAPLLPQFDATLTSHFSLREIGARLFNLTSGIVAAFGALVLVFGAGVYLAINPKVYLEGIAQLVVTPQRKRLIAIATSIGETLRWWLIGRLSAMFLVGVCTWLGLYLLNVPLSFALACLTMLFGWIPNFGPLAAALPAVILGFEQGPQKALYVLLLYLVVQLLEGYLFTPLIQKQAIRIPPALLLFSQVAFGYCFGLLGLLLATPLVAAGAVLFKEVYVKGILPIVERGSDRRGERHQIA